MPETKTIKPKKPALPASFVRSLQISHKDLYKTYSAKELPFKTTAQILPEEEIIGQDKALKAIRMGVEMNSPGYNIFILGLAGTGKTTTVEKILNDMADKTVELYDFVALHNFAETDRPVLLRLKAGEGQQLKKDMLAYISFLKKRIPQALNSEGYLRLRRKIVSAYSQKEEELFYSFEKRWNKEGFTLAEVQIDGKKIPDLVAISGEERIPVFALEEAVQNKKLTEAQAEEIAKKYDTFQPEVVTAFNKRYKIQIDLQAKLDKEERNLISHINDDALETLIKKYDNEGLRKYFASVKDAILDIVPAFVAKEEGEEESKQIFKMFQVNVLVDNQKKNKRPVVVEMSPSYNNIFGAIERQYSEKEGWTTDFTQIKAGSLLRADGGFLVMNARHLFEELPVWRILKRTLLHRKLEIIDVLAGNQFAPSALKPEPIEFNTKIILVGSSYLFSALSNYEDDFNKIFKIRAEFDYEVPNDKKMLHHYAAVLKKTINSEGLPEFDRDGVAATLEIAGRLSGSQNKLSTRFSFLADLAREAAYFARNQNAKIITRAHIEEAFTFMKERRNLTREKVEDAIVKNNILISTEGKKKAQVNGLAVYGGGFASFGLPVRITSSAGMGNGNIINVERESGYSGKSYDKALYIIAGFIRDNFGKRKPLSFSANIVFEQSYSPVDGDSATTAEMCTLLSAIGDFPVRQDIAITGSMNQKGEVQPIGGVNEKIEGFFGVCKRNGFTGTQGVIIPLANKSDLMLSAEVREAVKAGQFTIYGVSKIEECLMLLSGLPAGTPVKGVYPEGTVYGLIERRLEMLNDRSRHSGPHKEKNKTQTPEKGKKK